MGYPTKGYLNLLQAIRAVYLLIALMNGGFGIVRLATGWWQTALLHFATVAFIAVLYLLAVRPRYRRVKKTLRDRRIAELEQELGMR